jgi:hypothetical protein
MIGDTINQKIAEALKAHDEIRLSTLRMLSSAFNYEFIAKQHKLNEEEELSVVKKEAKKRQDAIESLRLAQSKPSTSDQKKLAERIKQEEKELEILREYLPAEMGDEDLQKLVDEAVKESGASEMKDMGRVIGMVMGKAKGVADGSRVAQMVKTKLID